MKTEQRERRKAEGANRAYVQHDGGSISSSDEEDVDAQAEMQSKSESKPKTALEKVAHGVAAPEEKITQWAQGDKEREKREEKDDMAAAGPS